MPRHLIVPLPAALGPGWLLRSQEPSQPESTLHSQCPKCQVPGAKCPPPVSNPPCSTACLVLVCAPLWIATVRLGRVSAQRNSILLSILPLRVVPLNSTLLPLLFRSRPGAPYHSRFGFPSRSLLFTSALFTSSPALHSRHLIHFPCCFICPILPSSATRLPRLRRLASLSSIDDRPGLSCMQRILVSQHQDSLAFLFALVTGEPTLADSKPLSISKQPRRRLYDQDGAPHSASTIRLLDPVLASFGCWSCGAESRNPQQRPKVLRACNTRHDGVADTRDRPPAGELGQVCRHAPSAGLCPHAQRDSD